MVVHTYNPTLGKLTKKNHKIKASLIYRENLPKKQAHITTATQLVR